MDCIRRVIYGECGSFTADRSQSDVARAVKSVAGSLSRVAEHGVVEVFRIQSRTLDGALGRDGSELLRLKSFSLPQRRKGGVRAPLTYGDVSWFQHRLPNLEYEFCNKKSSEWAKCRPVSLTVEVTKCN